MHPPNIITEGHFFTRKEVAAKAHVSVETVKRWQKNGLLHGQKIGPKLVRFAPEEVAKLLANRGTTS